MKLKPHKPDELDKVKLLIYGEPGAGKTVFSGTAQECSKTSNALMISAEAGTLSIRDKDIDVVEPSSISEFNEIFEWVATHARYRDQYEQSQGKDKKALENLQKLHYQFHGEKTEKPKLYQTVIIDNITEVNVMASYEILGIEQDTIDSDPPVECMRDWGKIKKMVTKIVRSFRNLPIHVIMTAHKIKDGEGPDAKIKPAVTGSLKDELPGFFDIVGLLEPYSEEVEKDGETQKVVKRYLMVEGTDKFIAKDRSGSLGSYIESPTVSKVMTKIK